MISRRNREQNVPTSKQAGHDHFSLLALSIGLQLIIAGCGGDDGNSAAESSTAGQEYGGASAAAATGGSGTNNSSGTTGGNATGTGGGSGTINADAGVGGAGHSTSDSGGTINIIEGGEGGSSILAEAGGAAGQDEVDGGDEQSDAGEDPDGSTQTQTRRCLSNGSQIVLIGDSYINWITHTFPQDMNEIVGQPVRNYAIGAFSMASGGLGLIPPQLDLAISEDPDIIAVVMTGGGNDILIPDVLQFPQGGECKNDPDSATIPDCQAIVNLAIDTAVETMDKLVDAGIPDVIYFFYPEVPSTWLAADPNGILRYALPLAKEACDSAYDRTNGALTCHFIDLNPVFEGHPEYFAEADLHENSEGSAAIVAKIWEVMVDNCIAQPESSGCCTP